MLLEANIPAPQPPAAADARIPPEDADRERPEGAEPAPGEGPSSSHRLASLALDGRLRSRKDFQTVYEKGTAARGSLVTLIVSRNGGEASRWAVIASKKVGGAVVRNRCKRLLREAYRALRSSVDLEGRDLVLIARPACRKSRIWGVIEELEFLYRSVGIWK